MGGTSTNECDWEWFRRGSGQGVCRNRCVTDRLRSPARPGFWTGQSREWKVVSGKSLTQQSFSAKHSMYRSRPIELISDMKTKLSKCLAGAIAVVVCLTSSAAVADKAAQIDAAKGVLRAVAAPEMPAKAAQLVSQAKVDARETTAEAVVTAAIQARPVALIPVVSAIARENPEVAGVTAATAVGLQPKEAAAIAKAAAAAAPSQVSRIVTALCKAVPANYALFAAAASQAVPYADKEILAAVTTALPALKPFIDRARTEAGNPSLALLMGQTERLVAATAKSANISPEQLVTPSAAATPARTALASAAPVLPPSAPMPPVVVGPPFTPLPGSPGGITPPDTGEVPPGGGRDYSGP